MTYKMQQGVDKLQFAKKDDSTQLKPEVDQLDIDELKTTPVDLSKLSNAVNNDVVKKDVYYTIKNSLDKTKDAEEEYQKLKLKY